MNSLICFLRDESGATCMSSSHWRKFVGPFARDRFCDKLEFSRGRHVIDGLEPPGNHAIVRCHALRPGAALARLFSTQRDGASVTRAPPHPDDPTHPRCSYFRFERSQR